MIEGSKPDILGSESHETPTADATFPSEPFPCPACGQMLGPTCRVCVACKQPIDPAQIVPAEIPVAALEQESQPQLAAEPPVRTRFSWSILLLVLAIWLLTSSLVVHFLSQLHAQLVMAGLVVLSSIWVQYDARARGIPRPLRWSLGCLLLWIVFFPWYLARRRTPQAVCPLVEDERGPLFRALLISLLVFFITSAILLIIKGPPPK